MAWLAGAGLLVAFGSTVWLSLHTIFKIAMPGCGPGSPCDEAGRSVWGSIPGLGWPVSFVGLAYFAAILAGWLIGGCRLRSHLRWIPLAGGAVSVMYLVVSVVTGLVCPYCVAANLGNLAFVGLAAGPWARSAASSARGAWAVPAGVVVFAVTTGMLLVAREATQTSVDAASERLRAEDAARMVGASGRDAAPGGAGRDEGAGAETGPAPTPIADTPGAAAKAFTGRWRRGPEAAAVRIVVFTDFQCADCKLIEAQIAEQLEGDSKESPRISLSTKHFPFCTACNPRAPNLHANACWAARAAEAAGMLYGNEGFWKMHDWLFARGGAFTDAQLDEGLAQLGFERQPFLAVMQSKATLERVQADIAEGWDLGLYRTPMVFINGVELRGWMAPGAVSRTVREMLAVRPPLPARGAEADRPPPALSKYLEDWRVSARVTVPEDPARPVLGRTDAPVRVVLWGDLQEPGTCEADRELRARAGTDARVRYEYRHWPFNRACNPVAPRDQFPRSCLAARAAEAGGFMFGPDGYWRTHEWLVNNRERLSEQALRDGLPALGMDGDEFFLTMENPDLAARIEADARAGQGLGLTSLPTIFVNGRPVPRWKMGARSILAEVIDAAAREPGGP
ncbi:MAG: thioredoxin domain-containing protein [Phycisphaerales bacterium]